MKSLNHPTILVVRHGATGMDDILKGMMNPPLNSEGRAMAKNAAEFIADYFPVEVVNHSPLDRAAETAQIIAKAVGAKAVPCDALGPMDVGRMSGMKKDAAADWMRYYIQHPEKTPPGGKPIGDWYKAFDEFFLKEMAEAKKNPDKARVEATHSSESVNIPSVLQGGEICFQTSENSPAPGSILKLEFRGGKWRMTEIDPSRDKAA